MLIALQLLFSTALAADSWTIYDMINTGGNLVIHSTAKNDDDMALSYSCYSKAGKTVGNKITLGLVSHEGTWAPINEPLVIEAEPTVEGNSLIVSLVTGNFISIIKSWRIMECESCLVLSKNFGDISSPLIDSKPFSPSQLRGFRTADYIAATVNGDTYALNLDGSSSAFAATDAACNR